MAHCRRHYRLEEASEEEESASGSPKIAKLLDYINAHYMEEIPLSTAAEIMGYEPSYCSKVFKKLTGVGFSKYLNSVRIEHAIRYLREPEQTVTEIAMRCGFSNIRNFNRTFREIAGRAADEVFRDEPVLTEGEQSLYGAEYYERDRHLPQRNQWRGLFPAVWRYDAGGLSPPAPVRPACRHPGGRGPRVFRVTSGVPVRLPYGSFFAGCQGARALRRPAAAGRTRSGRAACPRGSGPPIAGGPFCERRRLSPAPAWRDGAAIACLVP